MCKIHISMCVYIPLYTSSDVLPASKEPRKMPKKTPAPKKKTPRCVVAGIFWGFLEAGKTSELVYSGIYTHILVCIFTLKHI